MMLKKVYFEITNVCNLSCSFCPKTQRKPRFVSVDEFRLVAEKLKGRVEYLYLHLMGEPTLHSNLRELIEIASDLGFKVIITTNGTTLSRTGDILVQSDGVYKISISVHSFEANPNGEKTDMDNYLAGCFEFASKAAQKGKICVFRLWNLNGEHTVGQNELNSCILDRMRRYFGENWVDTRSGKRICDKIFLEYGEKFEWPDPESDCGLGDEDLFCHGLRDQIGILSDGTVVPCCLDSEGTVRLGNIFDSTLEEILSSSDAVRFYDSFTKRKSPTALCSSCGYAKRFSR